MKPLRYTEQSALYSRPFLLAMALLIAGLLLVVFQSSSLVDELGMSRKVFWLLAVAVPAFPLLWLVTWNNSRLCLIITTVLMLFGDMASAICAPAIIAITLPNCLALLLRWRTTRLRYLVAPLVVLGVLYFFTAFFMDVVSHPVQLTNRMQFDPGFPPLILGWMGSLLGFTIVYPLIYIPFLLYDISRQPGAFRERFLLGLSLIVNLILLYGIVQFVQAGGLHGVTFRVSSIMRLPTRLGPFIVVFMTLNSILLMEAKTRLSMLYWLGTLLLSTLVLMMTQTRIAIIAAGLLVMMLFVALVASRNGMLVKRFLIGGLVLLLGLGGVIATGKVDFLSRFDSSNLESGHQSREQIMKDYEAGVNLENVTSFQKAAHFLFGFGMFRERQFAHFNLHDTMACCLSVFGAVGLLLYYGPYLAICWIMLLKTFTAQPLTQRPRFAMAATTMLIFFLTGAFHNKLYSPIETAFIWLTAGLLLWDELPMLVGALPNTWFGSQFGKHHGQ
jgi:hypothetical protein